jgi:hypothetical protein
LASPGGEAPVQKQRLNVYTVMLIISFICIVTSCIVLYMELSRWGNYPWWSTTDANPRAAWIIHPEMPEFPRADLA